MSLPNGSNDRGITVFWGVVLSIAFHLFIFSLVMFWGFGGHRYSAQPNFIEGTLVSLSELNATGGSKETENPRVKQEPNKRRARDEKKAAEKPKNEPVKEKPKKVEKPPEKESKPAPKVVKKEEKKEELKKEKEQTKDKNVVALETKKEAKRSEKKPEPTKKPEAKKRLAKEKNEKPNRENEKSKVIKEIQETVKEEKRRSVLDELKKEQGAEDEKLVAEANTTERSAPNSNGGSPLGGGTNAVVTNLFLDRIRNEIRQHYRIPPNIPTDGKLETFIFFKINESGRVYDVRVNDSSGNPAFDDLCVKAIYRSAPLTPPPPELMEQARNVGFLIPFTNDPS